MLIQSTKYQINIFHDNAYTTKSADNVNSYSREYILGEYISSRYGINVEHNSIPINSCILLAGGGPTTVHDHSALIIEDNLFVAIGDQICCTSLPALDLRWHIKADTATCFGIYYSDAFNC